MRSFRPSNRKKDFDVLEQSSPDRYGDLSKQIANQRRLIFSLLILVAFLIMILGSLAFKFNTKVFVIEKDHNNYTYLGYTQDLTQKTYIPDDKSLEYFLNNFVIKSRYLPTDLVLYKKNQKELGYFMSSKSVKKLDSLLERDGYPLFIEKNAVVDVELISTLRLSPETFQIRWFEKIFDQKGALLEENVMVGLFRYEIKKPSNKEAVIANPLGVVVTDLSISKEQ